MFSQYIIPFTIALILAAILTPIVSIVAKKIGAVDLPNQDRKIHTKIVPRLGGLAIYTAFSITALINIDHLDNHIKGLMLGSLVIIACGVLDDLRELNYKTKLAFQILASLMLVFNDVVITKVSLFSQNSQSFFELGILSIPLTILWVVGVTNALNLIDGLDGLACGLSAISCIFLFIIAVVTNNVAIALILIILAGACLGFLPYNFNPAKIFLGDSGSLFLGFILAGISIQGTMKSATTLIMFVPLLIIGLPIYDTLAIMIRRFLKGKPIMAPDKEHFHHRMLSMGLSQKQVALLSYLVNIVLGCIGLTILLTKNIKVSFIVFSVALIIFCILLDNVLYIKKRTSKEIRSKTTDKQQNDATVNNKYNNAK